MGCFLCRHLVIATNVTVINLSQSSKMHDDHSWSLKWRLQSRLCPIQCCEFRSLGSHDRIVVRDPWIGRSKQGEDTRIEKKITDTWLKKKITSDFISLLGTAAGLKYKCSHSVNFSSQPIFSWKWHLVIFGNVRVAGLVRCDTRLSSEVSSASNHVDQ